MSVLISPSEEEEAIPPARYFVVKYCKSMELDPSFLSYPLHSTPLHIACSMNLMRCYIVELSTLPRGGLVLFESCCNVRCVLFIDLKQGAAR